MRDFTPRVKGLIPVVDRKQVAEPYVVEGKNFVMNSQGPASALGRDMVSYKGIENPQNIQFHEVSETVESFICTDEGIFRLDTNSTRLICLYKFTFRLATQYPWTKASVGNKVYFARAGYNLIEYDLTTNSWSELTGGSIPENIHACDESEGRLVVVTNLWIAWSAIGDGTNFVASQFTGAGAQALTKIGIADSVPLAIKKTPEGFLTFLSTGIIRSQSIQALIPYRHTVLSYEHVPLNPFCVSVTVDQSIIMLTTAGLFKTAGKTPEPWQPLMGQYLKENIIPSLDLINNQNNPQLFFDYDNSWFAIGISENQTDYVFTKAYILNIPLDEWGSLDTQFVKMVDVKILPVKFIGFYYGLVDTQGNIFIINAAKGVEYIPELTSGLYYKKPWGEIDSSYNNDVLRCITKADFRTVDTHTMTVAGLYDRFSLIDEWVSPLPLSPSEKVSVLSTEYEMRVNTTFNAGILDVNVAAEPRYYETLDSLIKVGLFQLPPDQVNNHYSYITNVLLGMIAEGVGETVVDWNSLIEFPTTITEDWNVLSGEEDWGDAPVGSAQFGLTVVPTNDGYNQIADTDSSSELIEYSGKNLKYGCYVSGVYHLVVIDATNFEDNFYLKTIDLNLNVGGMIL